jgi:hypothetical protein
MRAITSRPARRTGGEPAPEARGARRIDITVHVEFPAPGEPGTRDPLRDMLARAVIFLVVLAAAVASVALASGAPGGGIWAAISRLASLLSGG